MELNIVMPDNVAAIIKLRRGLDSERRTIILDSGEIAYSTDIKRVFIGDSATLGGTVVGNKNYIGSSPNINGVKYDLFFNTSTNQTYILSSDSGADNIDNYVNISQKADGVTLSSNNGVFSINGNYFNNSSTGFLRLSGGTMGGYITLHANPVSAFHAATKGFVDSSLSLLNSNLNNYVKLSGDTMTGKLTILSSFEVDNGASIGGTLNVTGDTNIVGSLDLKNNLFKDFRPVIKNVTLQSPVSTYTLLESDNGSIVVLSGDSASCKVYCPEGFQIGYNVMVIQNSDANVYILPDPASSATVNQIDGYKTIRKKYGVCNTVVISPNTYILAGDLS